MKTTQKHEPQSLTSGLNISQRFSTGSLLVIAFIIFDLIINHLFKQQLFKMGVNMIIRFQKQQNLLLNVLFYLITMLVDPAVVMLFTIALLIQVTSKQRAFITVLFILFNTYFTGVLKAFYADARPYWASKHVESIGLYCPQEYGNPSGHSWFSVVLGFAVVLEYWGVGKNNRNVWIVGTAMVLVPMSRMYLGAHSLNQVLQGLSLGLAMVYLFKFDQLKYQLESFLKNFNSQPKMKWVKVIVLMHILYILCFLYNQDDVNPYFEKIPEKWIKNIAQKCNGKEVDTNYLNFMMLMVNSIIVNICTGIGLGFSRLIKAPKGRIYLSGDWQMNNQLYSRNMGLLYFYMVEIAHLLSGFALASVCIYILGPQNHAVIFVFANLGALLSGYVYTSMTYQTLFQWQVIRQKIE